MDARGSAGRIHFTALKKQLPNNIRKITLCEMDARGSAGRIHFTALKKQLPNNIRKITL
jgi:hypothetical protein